MYTALHLLGKGVNIEKADLFHILDNMVTWEDIMDHEVLEWHVKKLQLSPTSKLIFSIWYEVVDKTVAMPEHYNAYLQINSWKKIGPMRLKIGGKYKKYFRFFYPVIVMNEILPSHTSRILQPEPKTLAMIARFKIREYCKENKLNELPIL